MTGDFRDDAFGGPDAQEPLDLSSLDVAVPPPGFAERVVAQARARTTTPFFRRRAVVALVAASVAAAALVVWRTSTPDPAGHLVAPARLDAPLGSRARVVLEPGAELRWHGDDVEQPRGEVFYRVEPGARFRVHTPAGDVEVRGTCFTVKLRNQEEEEMHKRDFKVGSVGAALGAIAFVTVHEGIVSVSHAQESAELRAGEGARVGGGHVVKTTAAALVGESPEDDPGAADEGWSKANRSLAEQVRDVRRRLDGVAAQKADLEERLADAQKKLAAAADGATPRTRSEFDLDAADWADLAREGKIKYAIPCLRSGFIPSPGQLEKAGLAPQDAPAITDAYDRSFKRVWAAIRPICQAALGAAPEVVDKIGPDTCSHIIHEQAMRVDDGSAREAFLAVAEIRAKLRPEPGAGDKVHPITKLFMAMTGEMSAFEADLAKSFGPEEAHRLAYGEGLCKGFSTWGGGKKRE